MPPFSRFRPSVPWTSVKQPRLAGGSLGAALLAAGLLGGCGDTARLPPGADEGARPTLLPPVKSLLPTLKIAPAKGWPEGELPRAPAGFRVTALERGLAHPRWLYVLPNGDVHGSWNRKPLSGYKVVFVPFADGRPSGAPVDFLAGFVSPEGDAWGRPVGVALDARGALLVADDVGNIVWRVAPR